MHVIAGDEAIPSGWVGSVVALGAFDGVHLGHQAVLRRSRERRSDSSVRSGRSIVVTWEPPDRPALVDLPQRRELLGDQGVDGMVVLEGPDGLLDAVERLAPSLVVAGPVGNARAAPGTDVDRVDEVVDEHGAITAERVRESLLAGDVERAGRLLGRPPAVRGVVERGDERGRELGFPTANVTVPAMIVLPADGVYGGRYRRPDGTELPAAISVGRRPTFYDDDAVRLVEPFLLDFSGELYGEEAEVVFDSWVRGQVRFDGVDALVAQMGRDVELVRERAGL